MFSCAKIKGIKVILPKKKLSLQDLSDVYDENYIKKVIAATGIKSVHVAEEGYTTSDYCIRAADRLFEEMCFDRNLIDAVVFVTQTPDYIVPHTSAIIQDRLSLRKDIATFDLNFGCPGFLYGIFQAHMLISTGMFKNVLLCCGDTISKYINEEDKAMRLVMGDGCSASLISFEGNSISDFDFFCDGSRAKALMIPAGSNRMPRKAGVTDLLYSDDEGNRRTQEDIYMDGLTVMDFALHDVTALIKRILVKMNWTKDDIDSLVLHQANRMIVNYVAKKVKVDKSKVMLSVEDTGNTGSCSIPLALCKELASHNEATRLSKVVMCAFGTGLSAVAAGLNLQGTYFGVVEEF